MTQTASSPTVHGWSVISKHRIEALADGLFAIVMTLLVLELKVPDLPKSVSSAEIMHELAPMWRVFFSFVLTFALASIFWMTQQTILNATRTLDRVAAALHLFALMFVSLLPFSTAMLGHYLGKPIGMGLYFGNQTVIAAVLCRAWFRERNRGNINEMPSEDERRISLRIAGMTATYLGATIVACFEPRFAFYGALPGIIGSRAYFKRGQKAR